jgi:hypothetical protein
MGSSLAAHPRKTTGGLGLVGSANSWRISRATRGLARGPLHLPDYRNEERAGARGFGRV